MHDPWHFREAGRNWDSMRYVLRPIRSTVRFPLDRTLSGCFEIEQFCVICFRRYTIVTSMASMHSTKRKKLLLYDRWLSSGISHARLFSGFRAVESAYTNDKINIHLSLCSILVVLRFTTLFKGWRERTRVGACFSERALRPSPSRSRWRRSIPVARNNGASLQEPKRANAFKTIPLFWRDSRKLAVPHLFAASYSSRYMHAILFTSNEYFSRLLEQRTRRLNANSSRETLLVVSCPFPTVVNFDL